MNKDEPIVIRRTGNGYIVSPLCASHIAVSDTDTLVFNDMGYSGGNRDDGNVPYLLRFIEQHFSRSE